MTCHARNQVNRHRTYDIYHARVEDRADYPLRSRCLSKADASRRYLSVPVDAPPNLIDLMKAKIDSARPPSQVRRGGIRPLKISFSTVSLGTISFIPLFVQSVLGASPTQAGVTVTPMLLGWVACSIFGSRILLKVGYRRLSIIGTSIFFVGAFLLAFFGVGTNRIFVMVFVTLMGMGMGLSIPAYVIAVQTTVERRRLGVATSMLQFSRSMAERWESA